MTPVFARTRHPYDSYTDYWRLVELSGFATCYVDEMDLSREGAIYIVSPVNGEFRPHMEAHGAHRRARVIWWNLERPDAQGCPPLSSVLDDICRYVDSVWVSDRHYASLDPRQTFVVLGSHPDLGAPPAPPAYDFTHQSYVWGRRQAPIEALRRRWTEGPNAWGPARDHVLRTSRLMVNVHQTPAPVGEPLRFALAAAYHLPLVSETLADPFPLVESIDFRAVPIGEIPRAVEVLLAHGPAIRETGNLLHERLCMEWTFRRGIEEAIR